MSLVALDVETLAAELGVRRLVPVVTLRDAADAPELGRALADGGLPVAEVTFRTEAAPAAIELLRAETPEVLVGAGTVLDVRTVDVAVASGAQFVVTPGFNPAVVDRCLEAGIAVVPGVSTPTEVEMALARGIRHVKFFPAESSGGTRMLRDLSGPYSSVRFMPTGGVTPTNLLDYLSLPSVLACGGTWLVTADAVAGRRFEDITRLVAEAVALVATAPSADAAGAAQTLRPLQNNDK